MEGDAIATATACANIGVSASFFGDSGIEIVTVAASCCLAAAEAAAAAVLLGVVEGEEFCAALLHLEGLKITPDEDDDEVDFCSWILANSAPASREMAAE